MQDWNGEPVADASGSPRVNPLFDGVLSASMVRHTEHEVAVTIHFFRVAS